jgi:hypothetical protein
MSQDRGVVVALETSHDATGMLLAVIQGSALITKVRVSPDLNNTIIYYPYFLFTTGFFNMLAFDEQRI